jgi:hypothetical protein
VRYALSLLLVAACYQAPDYGGTRFKCDDEHGCPEGQTCIAGFCSIGTTGVAGFCSTGGTGNVDAKQPDSPQQQNANGVLCGTVTCSLTQKCCADVISGPTCVGITAVCAGLAAVCDGTEDCNGTACCSAGQNFVCSQLCQDQTTQICREPADCLNASAPNCCFNTSGTPEPWGRCLSQCP